MTYPRRAFMRSGAAVLAPAPPGYSAPELPAAAPGPSAGILRGRLVIVSGPNAGVFVYSGNPALGNPPIFWATSASVDPFGNVISSTAGIGSGGTFSVSGTETVTGTLNVSGALNVTGSASITNPGKLTAGNIILTTSGLVGYSGAPAANNAIFSEAPAQFTDAFGNVILAGTTTYGVSGITYYALNQLPGIDTPGTFGAVTSVFTATSMAGPWTVGGQINLSGSAHIEITGDVTHLFGATGQPTLVVHNSNGLLSAASTLTATAGGALGIQTQAGLAGQAPITIENVSAFGNNNLAGANRVTAIYTLGADMQLGTTYCIEAPFVATFAGVAADTLELGLSIDGNTSFTVNVTINGAIVGAGVSVNGVLRVYLKCITTGAGGTVNAWTDGSISQTSATVTFTNSGGLAGNQAVGVALDTTVSHDLRINSLWAVSNATQALTVRGSKLTRTGA